MCFDASVALEFLRILGVLLFCGELINALIEAFHLVDQLRKRDQILCESFIQYLIAKIAESCTQNTNLRLTIKSINILDED